MFKTQSPETSGVASGCFNISYVCNVEAQAFMLTEQLFEALWGYKRRLLNVWVMATHSNGPLVPKDFPTHFFSGLTSEGSRRMTAVPIVVPPVCRGVFQPLYWFSCLVYMQPCLLRPEIALKAASLTPKQLHCHWCNVCCCLLRLPGP